MREFIVPLQQIVFDLLVFWEFTPIQPTYVYVQQHRKIALWDTYIQSLQQSSLCKMNQMRVSSISPIMLEQILL